MDSWFICDKIIKCVEGQWGEWGSQYSSTGIRNVLHTAKKKAGVTTLGSVHTLRHSVATHCIENNVNLRHIQNMLGHSSPKTTEVYTKTIEINNKKIASPIDSLIRNINL